LPESANGDDSIAERTGDGLIDSKDNEMIEEIDGELANVIEDFLHAVEIEVAKRIGKHTLPQYRLNPFLVALCRPRGPAQVS
jgi:hypothetical protein